MGIFARLRRKKPEDQLRAVLGDYKLPSFSKVLVEARGLLRSPDSTLQQISDCIAADPGSTVKILRTTNSAAIGLRNRVNSVEQAIALLGRAQVESILLAQGVSSVLPRGAGRGYNPHKFWGVAARRAVVSRDLAARFHPASASASFTASLLQDMAVPVLSSVLADSYRDVLTASAEAEDGLGALERERFGWDHAEIGGWMCEAWAFPDLLISCIVGHHGTKCRELDAPPAVQAASLLPDDLVANDIEAFATHLADVHSIDATEAESIVVAANDASTEIASLFA